MSLFGKAWKEIFGGDVNGEIQGRGGGEVVERAGGEEMGRKTEAGQGEGRQLDEAAGERDRGAGREDAAERDAVAWGKRHEREMRERERDELQRNAGGDWEGGWDGYGEDRVGDGHGWDDQYEDDETWLEVSITFVSFLPSYLPPFLPSSLPPLLSCLSPFFLVSNSFYFLSGAACLGFPSRS